MYQVYYTSPNEPESIESEKGRRDSPFDAFASGKYYFMGFTFERIPVLPVPAFHEEPGISVVLRPGMVAFGPCCHRTSPRESRSLYRPDRLRPSYRNPNTKALLAGQVLGAQVGKPGAQLPGVLHTAVNDLPPNLLQRDRLPLAAKIDTARIRLQQLAHAVQRHAKDLFRVGGVGQAAGEHIENPAFPPRSLACRVRIFSFVVMALVSSEVTSMTKNVIR